MRLSLRSLTVALGICSSIAAGLPSALAHPVTVTEDHSDNVAGFEYEASTGEMPSETSRGRDASENDEVTFTVVVRESEDAGSGLIGRLKLRLDGEHRTTYDGWFIFKVTDEDGDVAFHKSRPASLQLHPKPGMRRASLTFRFDVPSGSYEATGSFQSE